MTPWPFETSVKLTKSPVGTSDALNYGEYYMRGSYWHGYSDYDWYIDKDWLLRVAVGSIDYTESGSSNQPLEFGVCGFDISRVPSVFVSHDQIDYTGASPITGSPIYSDVYGTTQEYDSRIILYNKFSYHTVQANQQWSYFSPRNVGLKTMTINNQAGIDNYIDGTSINDLYLFVCPGENPSGTRTSYTEALFAVQFLCPKDKAPDGMMIGDQWPKVRTFKVEIDGEIEDFSTPYQKKMVEISGKNETALGNLNTQLKGYGVHTGSGLPDSYTSRSATSALLPIVSQFKPFKTLISVFGVFLVMSVFVKKGMG